MDRQVVDALKQMREKCRFMKGIFAWVGFKTTVVEYKVEARERGKSSFNIFNKSQASTDPDMPEQMKS